MNFIKAVLLGLIQGLTEFIPVSSSGHLLVFKKLFEMDPKIFGLTFDIGVHVATLIALFLAMWRQILDTLKKPRLILMLVIATIPAVIAGYFLEGFIENISESGAYLGICFLITAAVLWIANKRSKQNKHKSDIDSVSVRQSGSIGIAQAIAIIPGISRSGSTMATG
ncbi:MAG: undecaprenyl-diphosphate phosphatase, partial [Clostridiales bacterium]|nr:undecaprenyl-diphosphate phosphatase [Clostridiales bacterium]